MKPIEIAESGIYLNEIPITATVLLFEAIDMNRVHLRQWLMWVDHIKSEVDCKIFIENSLKINNEKTGLILGIWQETTLLGVISLTNIDKIDRCATLGYWLIASAQGKGYITKACRALINRSFSEYTVDIIHMSCVTENLKSFNVIRRLGFMCSSTIISHWSNGELQSNVEVTIASLNKLNWEAQEKVNYSPEFFNQDKQEERINIESVSKISPLKK